MHKHEIVSEILLALASACIDCRDEKGFVDLVRSFVQPLLPHRSLVAALGRVDLNHLEILTTIGVDHPLQALQELKQTQSLHQRTALAHWLRTNEPLVLQLPEDKLLLSDLERREMELYRLGRIAAHGVIDLAAASGSYFSFAGVPDRLERTLINNRLRLIAPHLHQAMHAVFREQTHARNMCERLSTVEYELLRWVAAGRSNSEIAALRGRSVATVRNQLSSVFRKLHVSSRAEAVRALVTRGPYL